jgi:hypothetical protein
MALPTPDQAAAAWAQRLAGSTDRIRQGVQSVNVAPGQAAARQRTVWAQRVQESQDSGPAESRACRSGLAAGDHREGGPADRGRCPGGPAQNAGLHDPASCRTSRTRSNAPAAGGLEQNIDRMTRFVRGMSTFQRR